MPTWRLLQPTDYRRVPWKNGLGTTLDLATDAPSDGVAWSWRFSLADVPTRAGFSEFSGIDRHLAVLEGEGLTLERGQARTAVPREGPAILFAGEEAIVGVPIGSGVRDANLMLDRRRWRGELAIVRATDARSVTLVRQLLLIHAASAESPIECKVGAQRIQLAQGCTLHAQEGVTLIAAACTLVIAQLQPVGSPS